MRVNGVPHETGLSVLRHALFNRFMVSGVLAVLWLPQALRAQICIPQAYGVPGLSGPPQWWPTGPSSTLLTLDDPRWRGATSRVLNGEVEFRALYKANSLYLSWQVKADLSLDPSGDQVYFGIKQQSGKPATVIQLSLASNNYPLNAALSTSFGIVVKQWTGSTFGWQPLSPLPSWITSTTAAWTRLSGTNYSWAFQIMLPVSTSSPANGLDLASPFEMWYAFLVKQNSTVTPYSWPSGISPANVFPDPTASANWEIVTLGSAGSCPADVALDPLQIGTDRVPDNSIEFTKIAAGSNSLLNEFRARPTNVGSLVIPMGSVEGRFFLANWGSTSLWQVMTSSNLPKNDGDISPPATAQSTPPRNDIHFQWAVPDVDRCRFGDPSTTCNGVPQFPHQCMLVQLSSSTASLVFRNQSVYRNMNFLPLSRQQQEAEVSVRGLAALVDGRPTRDMYLYVETRKLPPSATASQQKTDTVIVAGKDVMIRARRDTTFKLPWGPVRMHAGDSLIVPTQDTILLPARDNVERLTTVRAAAQAGRLTSEEVDGLVPTYRVHAYHTTGDTVVINGVKHTVLEPQPSFGYYVGHDGELLGWRHELKDANLVQLAPNFYRIAVPNNGVATVTTTIEAVERPSFAVSLPRTASA